MPELRHALTCLERADEFDVVNDHSGPLAAALSAGISTPFVHTVHGPLDGDAGEVYEQIVALAPGAGLISLSLNQRKPLPDLPWVANCPNALDLEAYPATPHTGEYLLFLGRMSPDKGCHRAIEVAKQADIPLKIAGKVREPAE
ncbi:MAG: glycosyltransferase family 4 protein, partial [Actinobacteria bacterium]